MQEQDEMDMEQLYAEVEDLKHESVGHTALSSFENGSLFWISIRGAIKKVVWTNKHMLF